MSSLYIRKEIVWAKKNIINIIPNDTSLAWFYLYNTGVYISQFFWQSKLSSKLGITRLKSPSIQSDLQFTWWSDLSPIPIPYSSQLESPHLIQTGWNGTPIEVLSYLLFIILLIDRLRLALIFFNYLNLESINLIERVWERGN